MRKSWKKLLGIFCLLCLLAGCVPSPQENPAPSGSAEIIQPDDDKPQGALVALVYTQAQRESELGQAVSGTINRFSAEEGVNWASYLIEGESFEAAYSTLELSIKSGARVVVMLGEESSAYWKKAQQSYSDVAFFILGSEKVPGNGVAVEFSYNQAGYVAGYAAVQDGVRNIYLLNSPDERNKTQAYFNSVLLGCDAACAKLGLEAGAVQIKELSFSTVEADEDSSTFFEAVVGNERGVLFAYSQKAQAFAAQLLTGTKVDMVVLEPQPGTALSHVQAVLKPNPSRVLYDLLAEWKEHGFEESARYLPVGMRDECVEMDMESSNYQVFGNREYTALLQSLESSVLTSRIKKFTTLQKNGWMPDAQELPLNYVSYEALRQREMLALLQEQQNSE